MPDFGSPVAVNVNVNPNQGIQTLSGLLSLKQQKLALETGQFEKERTQAVAGAAQIETQGKQEAAGFFKNFDFAKHIGPDGTLDLDAAYNHPLFKNAGPGKQLITDALLNIKNGQIKNKADMATLNNTVVAGGSRLIGALVKDPDVVAGNDKGLAKINSQIGIVKDMYGDQGRALTEKFEKVVNGDHISPTDRSAALRAFQLQGEDVSQQQQQQNPQNVSNAAGQMVNRDPATGALSAPAQSQPGLNPASPAVAGATAAATGGVASDVASYNTIRANGTGAAAIRGLAQQVAQIAKDVDTGTFTHFGALVKAGIVQRLGYKPDQINDPGVRRAILGKMAEQLISQAASSAPSDSVRQHIAESYPNPDTMPAGAVIEAARYVDGVASINQRRLSNAEAFKKTHSGNVTGLSSADSAFAQSADPLAAHYSELNPAAQREFLEKHFKDGKGKIDRDGVTRLIQNSNALKHSAAANGQVLGVQ